MQSHQDISKEIYKFVNSNKQKKSLIVSTGGRNNSWKYYLWKYLSSKNYNEETKEEWNCKTSFRKNWRVKKTGHQLWTRF